MNDNLKDRILQRHNEVINKAKELFPAYAAKSQHTVYFYETGRSAGLAHGHHKVGYNIHIFAQDPERFINDTIPHEIAHMVVNALNAGKGHDKNWKHVCTMLGGNGNRCYSAENITHKLLRHRKQYQYRASCGTLVMLSDVRHKRLQQEKLSLCVVKTKGKILPEHFTGVVK